MNGWVERAAAIREARVSRRVPTEGFAILVAGEERFQVALVDQGLCGMSILAPRPFEQNAEVVLEVFEEYGVDAYSCRVAFSQEVELGWQTGLEILERNNDLLVISIP